MTEEQQNDALYVCCLIEYVARHTHNTVKCIAEKLGIEGINKNLSTASVNHCLSFEQVCDETIEEYKIEKGNFDAEGMCKYNVPSFISIGKVYMRLLENINPKDIAQEIYNIFTSFISEAISDFNASIFYENSQYIYESYKAGYLLK